MRVEAFDRLRLLFCPVPEEWLREPSTASRNRHSKGGDTIPCKPCASYQELMEAWEKALYWTDGLDHGLVSMLASIASTMVVGDQLWLKVIGIPSCGKSVLCEALSTSVEHVLARSTIRGFNSGYRVTADDDEDNSLITQLFDKTLIVKDGDTLLQAPNLSQILSELRDIYDGANRPEYRNRMSKIYTGLRMTFLLSGTPSLRSLDTSELGERMLDCVIMDQIDEELEDRIGWIKIQETMSQLKLIANKNDPKTQHVPEMAEAMALTGGYVNYLRENVSVSLPEVKFPIEAGKRCQKLAKFVAYLRSRPSVFQKETVEREFSPRLIGQLGRLAGCLAFVLNLDEVTDEVMQRVRRIAMDTARGDTLRMTQEIFESEEDGLTMTALSILIGRSTHHTKKLLNHMSQIGIVKSFQVKTKGVRVRTLWGLTEPLQKLYREVLNKEG